MSMLDDVMTAREAEIVYGLAESTVKKACQQGRILARKSAGTWLVLRADAEQVWGKRRRDYVAFCLSDDDVVTLITNSIHASAWMVSWHRDEQGEEVPAMYNLEAETLPLRQFSTITELLDAMAALAPLSEWRVEGEDL